MHVVVCRSCVLDCEAEYELKGFCWQVASVYSAGNSNRKQWTSYRPSYGKERISSSFNVLYNQITINASKIGTKMN